jgi:hypothetical protein
MTIRSESWYRKTLLNKIYTNEINKKYKELSDKGFYIMFDKTTDVNGRYILHVMAGECSEKIESGRYYYDRLNLIRQMR